MPKSDFWLKILAAGTSNANRNAITRVDASIRSEQLVIADNQGRFFRKIELMQELQRCFGP